MIIPPLGQLPRSVILLLTVYSVTALGGITVVSEIHYEAEPGTPPSGETSNTSNLIRTRAAGNAYTTANATYQFEAISQTTNPFELKSKAWLDVEIDGRENNLVWSSVQASSRAVAGLEDTAIIEGVPDGIGGVVEFLWDVTGVSEISLHGPDDPMVGDVYFVNELSTTAILNPSEGGAAAVEVFRNDQSSVGLGAVVNSKIPAVLPAQSFAIDWIAGQEFPVYFELATVANLNISNIDAAGFNATLNSDFSNTATLQQIKIYQVDNEERTLLRNATMRSTDPTGPAYMDVVAVPEPSSGLVLSLITVALGGLHFLRRQNRLSQ